MAERTTIREWLILGVLMILSVSVILADIIAFPGIVLPAIVYAVPVILAAYLLPPQMVASVAATAAILEGVDSAVEGSRLWRFGLDMLAIVAFGYLATLLSVKMRQGAQLAERAQAAAADAELERAHLQTILQQMPAGVVIAEAPSGRITFASARTEQIWRRPFDPSSVAVGYGDWALYRLDGRPYDPEQAPLARSLKHGEVIIGEEVKIRRGDGSWGVLRVNSAPIRDSEGRVVAAVAAFDDITAIRELEERREDDIRMISHDLRNPLTPIMGQSSLLRRRLAAMGLEREARSADAILKNAQRMNSMIQELVESARIEAGRLELHKEPTDLCALIMDIIERLGASGERARLRLECGEKLPAVLADHDRLERAIVNLVSNALKYSAPDTLVVVRVEQRDNMVVVSVIDRGVGIPRDELPHIFERFYRARTAKRAEGLGLGLYITRLIVEAHGGRIWAESEVGKGSTFSFALPVKQDGGR